MTFDIIAGHIYSALFPFSDLSAKKRRPLLALGSPDERGDVRVAFITTTPVDLSVGFLLLSSDFDGRSLPFESYVRLDKTFNLHRSRIEKPIANLTAAGFEKALRKLIGLPIPQFAEHKFSPKHFEPGNNSIPPSGKVLGAPEIQNMVDASLDGWLTTGRFNEQFEEKLSKYLGVPHVLTTNSGSSANLLALTALTSPSLGNRSLKPGDEVITVAAGFPTTVNPILQNGLVPVFVDVDIPTYNIDVTQLEQAYSNKTKAVMIAHTLGNPYNLEAVKAFTEKYHLWLIEDCCDALGSTFNGRKVGTFGDIATLSFYPAHHITMGEGGAVFTQSSELKELIESFRDWGRDCYCAPGCDNTCGKRFDQQLGALPQGYDHKYTYSHLGYNLKITDMQAACGLAQMDRLPAFVEQRKQNFVYLKNRLSSVEGFLILPEATANSVPSWFGFPITLRADAGVARVELLKYLDQNKIGTRLLFAGNLTRQPYFENRQYRIADKLINTDRVMNQTFWVGVYPGLNENHLDYIGVKMEEFFGVNF